MRKMRKDCYFGLHYDFHAQDDMENIGGDFNERGFIRILDGVKPDYVQFDSKGHRGLTSYPTKFTNAAKGITGDMLKEVRRLTAERDIALLVHHSGVYDDEALKQHPDWAQVTDGKPSVNNVSVFSPYADEWLIPQLKELADSYDLEGAWVDGECWACFPDYSEYAQKAFEQETGARPTDETKGEYLQFLRRGFFDYVSHYVEELQAYRPNFDVTSNWVKSSFSPDPENRARVPYLSGDVAVNDSIYNGALLDTRFLAKNDLPWDIMVWSFRIDGKGNFIAKPTEQMCQEAAHALAMGGGCSVYYRSSPTRGIEDEGTVVEATEVAEFCRARQPFLQYAKPAKEALILFSCREYYDETKYRLLYSREYYMEDFRANLNALLDCQYHTTIGYLEDDLDLSQYGLVVLTNVTSLTPDEKARLLAYAEGGGTLLVSGGKIAGQFADVFEKDNVAAQEQFFVLEHGEKRYKCKEQLTLWQDKKYAVGYGYTHADDIGRAEKRVPLAFRKDHGKGRIALIAFDFGWLQVNAYAPMQQDFYRTVIGVEPMVQVKGTRLVHSVLTEKDGALNVSFINNAGAHQNVKPQVFDQIPPLYHLDVTIRSARCPKSIFSVQENREIPFAYEDGKVKLQVARLDIHEVLQLRF